MRPLLIATAIVVLAGAPAFALDCDNAMSQADMTQCANLDFETADKALNTAWSKVHAEIKSRDADQEEAWQGWPDALLAAQRDWLAFRDAECTSQGFAYRGGSMEPMVVASCKADLTTARTQQLLDLIAEE